MTEVTPIGQLLGVWIAAGLTLLIFSFIYKDNPAFKFAEALFLGVSLGYTAVNTYWNSIAPQVIRPLTPGVNFDAWVLLPVFLGLCIILRVIPSLSWLSRMAFAVYIAGYAGMAIPNEISGRLLPQVGSTMAPFTAATWYITPVILLGVFCTMMYFFFSLEHKGAVGRISRIGVVFVMISFGASFGYTVMARVSLLIGRMQFLFFDWLGLPN
ncbi:hypothetical protein KDL44_15940 [bacterium]|nr:hypothetical protein [bacterium]